MDHTATHGYSKKHCDNQLCCWGPHGKRDKPKNANAEYTKAKIKVFRKIAKLQFKVHHHGYAQLRDKNNWGFVGDLNHACELLDEILESMT